MKIRNDTDWPRYYCGLHIAKGAVVEIPEGMSEKKVAFLLANYTLVVDEPEPEPEPETVPEPDLIPDVIAEAPLFDTRVEEIKAANKARRKARRTSAPKKDD